MIFLLDSAFSLELIALAAGAALWVWGARETAGRAVGKAAAGFVMVAAILTMACTLYYGWRYREAGHFEIRAAAQGMPGMDHGGGMMKCPMMEKMQGKMGGESMPTEAAPEKGGHETHH